LAWAVLRDTTDKLNIFAGFLGSGETMVAMNVALPVG